MLFSFLLASPEMVAPVKGTKGEKQVDTKAAHFYPGDQDRDGRDGELKTVREIGEGGAQESDPTKSTMNSWAPF